MRKTRKQQLENVLSSLPEGKGIDLGDDVFLCGKELDGSDKVYGFAKVGGEVLVITRSSSEGYPVSDMDMVDIQYIFNYSGIFKKLQNNEYEIVDADCV